MIFKLVIAAIAYPFCAITVLAEWRTLRGANGNVIEVAVDFQIESMQLKKDREISMVAKTCENGEELGFTLKIGNWKEQTSSSRGKEPPIIFQSCDIEIRSLGLSTKRIDNLLRHKFGSAGQLDPETTIAAPYSGYCMIAAFNLPTVITANGADLCYDASEKLISAESFGIRLIVDAPMQLLRVYFSVPGGFYGSGSHSDRAREQWRAAEIKKSEER